jgi:hypothetical protein
MLRLSHTNMDYLLELVSFESLHTTVNQIVTLAVLALEESA